VLINLIGIPYLVSWLIHVVVHCFKSLLKRIFHSFEDFISATVSA
jgi:hypothetical protein